jgi:formamidopyrimidine-DNA glycosylase
MPELPEVETMRRGIAPIVGRKIASVERPRSSRRPIVMAPSFAVLKRRLTGATIAAVERAGKRLVLLADPPSVEHLRLRLTLAGVASQPERQLLFWDRRGLGVVRLLTPNEFERACGPHKLGPDALELSAGVLAERLAGSRRAIKVALLDQRALAGVGNLYASEILHAARISPLLRCDELAADEWSRLHRALRKVLSAAIRYEGSTLGDGTYRNALNKSGGYQNHHRVYGRGKRPCPTCREEAVERIVQAQRSTFFCPRCQPHRD